MPQTSLWTCGHNASAVCAECHRLLILRANELAEQNLELRDLNSKPLLHTPPNEAPLEELFAWVSVDANGNEGILADGIQGLGMTPLVTGKRAMAEGPFRKMAAEIARGTGATVKLARFRRDDEGRRATEKFY
jgi:hypothetical protein